MLIPMRSIGKPYGPQIRYFLRDHIADDHDFGLPFLFIGRRISCLRKWKTIRRTRGSALRHVDLKDGSFAWVGLLDDNAPARV